jgi:hypothetical protein
MAEVLKISILLYQSLWVGNSAGWKKDSKEIKANPGSRKALNLKLNILQ